MRNNLGPRINADVKSFTTNKIDLDDLNSGASYDGEHDHIVLEWECMNCGIQGIDEHICKIVIDDMRWHAGVKRSNLTIQEKAELSPVSRVFHNAYFERAEFYKDTDVKILNMTNLHVRVFHAGNDLQCDAPLVGEGYSVKR